MTHIATVPTKITKEQYEAAIFAKDVETGDEYIIWNGGKNSLWVGRYNTPSDWACWIPGPNNEDVTREEVTITDDTGSLSDIDAYVCPAKGIGNDLDLDALENGRIEWI